MTGDEWLTDIGIVFVVLTEKINTKFRKVRQRLQSLLVVLLLVGI